MCIRDRYMGIHEREQRFHCSSLSYSSKQTLSMKSFAVQFIGLLAFTLVSVHGADDCVPSQVHISLGDYFAAPEDYSDDCRHNPECSELTMIYIVYHTDNECSDSVVIYKSENSEKEWTSKANEISKYTQKNKTTSVEASTWIHVHELKRLTYGVKYDYKVKTPSHELPGFQFRVPSPFQDEQKNTTIIYFADLDAGAFGEVSIASVEKRCELNNAERIDAVLHGGDLIYEIMDEDGQKAARYFNRIQKFASTVPYMVNKNAVFLIISYTRSGHCRQP
eukprot:TRINITY_DN4439_c0_g2_i2.p1 TRINITY_DN4439_c0_g2~~TRINITY_DN4439_c0_g2_i2.p1  ORF type:complete len:298 (+),score=54.39 TRINITY_DN4439_c0_g2_i2:62-895(+)